MEEHKFTASQWDAYHGYLSEAEDLAPISNFDFQEAERQAVNLAEQTFEKRFLGVAFWHCAVDGGGKLPNAFAMTERMRSYSAKYIRLTTPNPESARATQREAEIYLGIAPKDITAEERPIVAEQRDYVERMRETHPPRVASALLNLELKKLLFQ